ncbi:hypothetical protein JKA74_07915 [Marivirga sp. S37H4]|uniref:J domain-containing protein n=1 Tax=Marivirga aurantiaca TaxID=2802615 RepID=A0A934WXI4_9BACT|nr:hypothetical protein [Marivirga aurantiaca]MBK6264959.1 hypothetical protein [Marivirga aurantiaca]
MNKLQKTQSLSEDVIQQLQFEIEELEKKLQQIGAEVWRFETLIRRQLSSEIDQIEELSDLHKQHKKEKKNKRLEQKKRGKNYKPPSQFPQANPPSLTVKKFDPVNQKELKRIYKEAVVQVHPDKISHNSELDQLQNASDLTARLNNIYKSGDLDELVYFYHHIILKNSSVKVSEVNAPDDQLRKDSLQKKKGRLLAEIDQFQNSYSYQVLHTYKDPTDFINELQLQFVEKIKQLEKRTRKMR